jgi:membrane fusion protein (multidrug efflux system)
MRARLDLEYTRIVAPFDGVVGRRGVQLGQRVQPGEQLLALVDLNHLWVTANFKETQFKKLKLGQRVRFKVDALGRRLDGWVESFSPASGARFSLLPPENATGNYVKVVQRLPARIGIKAGQPGQHQLRPGMSVEPRVDVR